MTLLPIGDEYRLYRLQFMSRVGCIGAMKGYYRAPLFFFKLGF